MRGFGEIAEEYDRGRRGENVEFWAEETARLAHLDDGSLVLDLGCGTGIYTLGIGLKTSASMSGLDPSVNMLRRAKAKSRSVSWFNAVGEWMPLRSGVFDCVFSSQV
ncbi:MAG: class I SAM-dependent methyltransferase [Candidatus Bathyarchaeia archaeon]